MAVVRKADVQAGLDETAAFISPAGRHAADQGTRLEDHGPIPPALRDRARGHQSGQPGAHDEGGFHARPRVVIT